MSRSRRIEAWGLALLTMSGVACRRGNAATILPAAAGAAPVAAWREGEGYVYRVKLSSTARVSLGAAPLAFELSGRLAIHPRRSSLGMAFLAAVDETKVVVEGDSGASVPAELGAELGGPWAVELTSGRARSLRVRGDAHPFSVAIINALAAAFQSPSGPAEGETWQNDETDGTGRYRARYGRGAESGLFAKTKVRYQKVSLPTGQQLGALDWSPSIIASRGELRFRDGDLVSFKSYDELQVDVTPASSVHSTTALELTLVDRGARAGGAADWDALWSSTAVMAVGNVPPPSPAARQAAARKDVANVTFNGALAALEQEGRPPAAGPGRQKAPAQLGPAPTEEVARERIGNFKTMVAVLRGRPEEAARVAAAVERRSPAGRALLDALGSSGSAEAQAVLVKEMKNRRVPGETRRQAAYALIRTARPTEASVSALIAELGEPALHDYALYGLGTYARILRKAGEIALANRASDQLLARLAVKMPSSARVDLLRGIANSGDARALDGVRPLLDDADDSIRAAAVDAIRLMPEPEVDGLLAKHLAPAERNGVRTEALEAIALRGPSDTLASAVAGAAKSAPDLRSRVKAVRLIERWMKDRPELRKVLEQVAASDARDEVRKAAQAGLGT
jgi:hypothetical protein